MTLFVERSGAAGQVRPSSGFLIVGGEVQIAAGYSNAFVSSPPSFGAGGSQIFADTNTGGVFGSFGNLLFVPEGYQSGDPIDSTSFYDGATFESLGIADTSFTVELTNGETIGIETVVTATVPVPATLPLGAAAIAMLWGLSRRRAA